MLVGIIVGTSVVGVMCLTVGKIVCICFIMAGIIVGIIVCIIRGIVCIIVAASMCNRYNSR